MFGMKYILGIVSVLFRLGISIIWAIPVHFIWSRIGMLYFGFLDERWLNIPYWHIVGLCILVDFVGTQIRALVPTIISINNSSTKKSKK
jgi:hypothetical protein